MPAETCTSPVRFQTFGVKKLKTESCICHTKFGLVTFILIMFILHKIFFHEIITENLKKMKMLLLCMVLLLTIALEC